MITGIDLSHHQNPNAIDYRKLAETQKFCIARASYGVKADQTFREHFSRAQEAGMLVGAYAFLRQNQPWTEQHEVFEAQLYRVSFGVGHILPVLDLEWNTAYDGAVRAGPYVAAAAPFLERLRGDYGGAIVYLSPGFYPVIGSPEWLRDDFHWWVAHHTAAAEPTCPAKPDWAIWQYTDQGKVPGFAGPLDLNRARELPLVEEALCREEP